MRVVRHRAAVRAAVPLDTATCAYFNSFDSRHVLLTVLGVRNSSGLVTYSPAVFGLVGCLANCDRSFAPPPRSTHGPRRARVMKMDASGKLREEGVSDVVAMLAPLDPPAIFAIGLNYRKHVAETGMAAPERPVVTMKVSQSNGSMKAGGACGWLGLQLRSHASWSTLLCF